MPEIAIPNPGEVNTTSQNLQVEPASAPYMPSLENILLSASAEGYRLNTITDYSYAVPSHWTASFVCTDPAYPGARGITRFFPAAKGKTPAEACMIAWFVARECYGAPFDVETLGEPLAKWLRDIVATDRARHPKFYEDSTGPWLYRAGVESTWVKNPHYVPPKEVRRPVLATPDYSSLRPAKPEVPVGGLSLAALGLGPAPRRSS